MSNNAHDLSNRLLNALDNNYNVVDMRAVNEIITILEKINITKELLETTRLGKHVNELRRKTSDATLARRAKVLVKRWRDLVIPTTTSPGHTGSNRSSAERQVRRQMGTPITSPALSRQVVSPAVPSPRPPSRPAWGGYESDSMDVIVVDDDPPPAPAPPRALTPAAPLPSQFTNAHTPPIPVKRPMAPEALHNDRKSKRDKKLKKQRSGHSRAGSGTDATPGALVAAAVVVPGATSAPTAAAAPGGPWSSRNGVGHSKPRGRNGTLDPYAALVNRIPKAGDKKVKTTKELLEQIQSRGSKPTASPRSPLSPGSPHSPDVILIEPDSCPAIGKSPLRNGSSEPRPPSPVAPSFLPLEDEREYQECTCGEELTDDCPAASRSIVRPVNVRALHNAYLPGINGTRAPTYPHQFAVRKLTDPEKPGLFNSVVPLYKYSDYADDYCVKNMSRLPLCTHIPWTEFAPAPPDLPPPPSPPPLRPYPFVSAMEESEEELKQELCLDSGQDVKQELIKECPKVEAEMVGVPKLEPSERLKAPLLSTEDETQFKKNMIEKGAKIKMDVEDQFETVEQEHRTVEKTKETHMDGRTLYALCEHAIEVVPYDYSEVSSAPVVTLPDDETASEALESALVEAEAETERDEFGRPPRAENFTEWHECARLGELIALPYVVID